MCRGVRLWVCICVTVCVCVQCVCERDCRGVRLCGCAFAWVCVSGIHVYLSVSRRPALCLITENHLCY